uniref:Efflux transporter periplasmic adaptor subunit n=1 Tax=Steinernema glaseri TaxID=37863 RepID=A0A1I7YHH3_9BILA
AAAPDLPRVAVQQVKAGDFAASVTLTGDVQARVQADLSFRVGGKIIERNVDVGDHVSANQTSAAFVRQQKLLPKGYTSQSEYDAAQAALRSSQSALKAAQAQLANAREQLSYTALIAEAPGVITARQAE